MLEQILAPPDLGGNPTTAPPFKAHGSPRLPDEEEARAMLRTLCDRNLGQVAAELMPATLAGCASDRSRLALRLIGQVLTERELAT